MTANRNGEISFPSTASNSVLIHGGDQKRRLTLAVKMRVFILPGVDLVGKPTKGILDTLILKTSNTVRVEAIEMYVRRPRAIALKPSEAKRRS
jgi:hypothetical protein